MIIGRVFRLSWHPVCIVIGQSGCGFFFSKTFKRSKAKAVLVRTKDLRHYTPVFILLTVNKLFEGFKHLRNPYKIPFNALFLPPFFFCPFSSGIAFVLGWFCPHRVGSSKKEKKILILINLKFLVHTNMVPERSAWDVLVKFTDEKYAFNAREFFTGTLLDFRKVFDTVTQKKKENSCWRNYFILAFKAASFFDWKVILLTELRKL